jgi:hypothetical protein
MHVAKEIAELSMRALECGLFRTATKTIARQMSPATKASNRE